jgi:hypothetical protein
MIGCRNLPTAVAGLLLTPLAAEAQKREGVADRCARRQNGGGAASSTY